jgi:HTH-type transcriptional regulator/antitoxin HigA
MPAVSPPGRYVREELQSRGWSQQTFAEILRRPIQSLNAIINGRKAITAKTAAEFALAFGTSAQVWLNLENEWQLSRARPDPAIAKRARKAS